MRIPKRCKGEEVASDGSCIFCDEDQGVACRLVLEENCPGHVGHRADPKQCIRCETHIDSLRSE